MTQTQLQEAQGKLLEQERSLGELKEHGEDGVSHHPSSGSPLLTVLIGSPVPFPARGLTLATESEPG